jgi:hypothetical protein
MSRPDRPLTYDHLVAYAELARAGRVARDWPNLDFGLIDGAGRSSAEQRLVPDAREMVLGAEDRERPAALKTSIDLDEHRRDEINRPAQCSRIGRRTAIENAPQWRRQTPRPPAATSASRDTILGTKNVAVTLC